MTFRNKNDIQNARLAIQHANVYPETSKVVVELILVDIYKKYGIKEARKLIQDFHLIP